MLKTYYLFGRYRFIPHSSWQEPKHLFDKWRVILREVINHVIEDVIKLSKYLGPKVDSLGRYIPEKDEELFLIDLEAWAWALKVNLYVEDTQRTHLIEFIAFFNNPKKDISREATLRRISLEKGSQLYQEAKYQSII